MHRLLSECGKIRPQCLITSAKPSNCTRTQHEHRSRSFDPRGARAEDGQGVGCWERWRVGTSCCAGKKRVACAFSNPAEQKKSHWNRTSGKCRCPQSLETWVGGSWSLLFRCGDLVADALAGDSRPNCAKDNNTFSVSSSC